MAEEKRRELSLYDGILAVLLGVIGLVNCWDMLSQVMHSSLTMSESRLGIGDPVKSPPDWLLSFWPTRLNHIQATH